MDHPKGCASSSLGGCLVLFAVIIVFISGFTLAIDQICYGEMRRFMETYPGAETRLIRNNFLRPYGIGETVVILNSEDDAITVRGWYGRLTGEELRAGRVLSRVSFDVTSLDDGGSQIILLGHCAQSP
jgi:hypothetical protein